MNAKTKKFLAIGLPILAAGGIIYALNRKKKTGDIVAATDGDVKPAALKPVTPVFPLKQGSRNEKVKELQRTIGAEADGIFGPNTENTLIKFAGVRIVRDQKELDDLRKKANGVNSAARAADLLKKFREGGVSMYVIKDTIADKIVLDAYGAVQYEDKRVTLHGGKLYNNIDYVLKTYTQAGKLIFDIMRGAAAGTYIIDPNDVTLK